MSHTSFKPYIFGMIVAFVSFLTVVAGASSADNVIEISTVQELQKVSGDLTAHYVLINDIDASETAAWNDGAGFNPIGGIFKGTFDGNGYTISGLTIDRPEDNQVGLFATNEGTIRNVTVADAYVNGHTSVAAVVGQNNGTLINVHSSGEVVGAYRQIAGVAGLNLRDGHISYSSGSAQVEGPDRWVGGLVGVNRGVIEKSFSTGDVTNTTGAGFTGAFVGANTGQIYDSYATGSASGSGHVGGFVGVNETETAFIYRSYSTGVVSRSSAGFAAVNKNGGEIHSSFWNMETSEAPSSADGIGLTSNEMADRNFWENAPLWGVLEEWDIDFEGDGGTTWYFLPGQNAPLLYPFASE